MVVSWLLHGQRGVSRTQYMILFSFYTIFFLCVKTRKKVAIISFGEFEVGVGGEGVEEACLVEPAVVGEAEL